MATIIDDTIKILESMNLIVMRVSTPPGHAGIRVILPDDSQAYFVWEKMDGADDYHFRIARFWEDENPFSMWVSTNLIQALAKTRILTAQ
jgi:hypothetical protein